MMEFQENNYHYEQQIPKCKEPKRKNCYGIIFLMIAIALATTIGILIGAFNASAIMTALASIIVLLVILVLLLVISIILWICSNKKRCKCEL